MKTAIIFADGLKQICLTPENDDEKRALRLITPDDSIELAVKTGTFYDHDSPYRPNVSTSRGGYLRMYQDSESIMLVLSPKSLNQKQST